MQVTTASRNHLIPKAYQLLKQQKGYSQVKVVKKLAQLNFQTTPPTFNKAIKNKSISDELSVLIFEGLQKLLLLELGYVLSEQLTWEITNNHEPKVIAVNDKKQENQGFKFHPEGRLKIADKVAFLATAEQEMIEFGTTLNTFSNYFETRRESEFKLPIKKLLAKGVHIKCYLLDPTWQGTHFYFDDRSGSIKEGLAGEEKIRAALRKLKTVHQEFAAAHLKGKFEVYTYRHFPHNYFLAIDLKDKSKAKMMISSYLYGQKRADCPVMEFTRTDEPVLFRRYLDSLEKLIKKAKKVNF